MGMGIDYVKDWDGDPSSCRIIWAKMKDSIGVFYMAHEGSSIGTHKMKDPGIIAVSC